MYARVCERSCTGVDVDEQESGNTVHVCIVCMCVCVCVCVYMRVSDPDQLLDPDARPSASCRCVSRASCSCWCVWCDDNVNDATDESERSSSVLRNWPCLW